MSTDIKVQSVYVGVCFNSRTSSRTYSVTIQGSNDASIWTTLASTSATCSGATGTANNSTVDCSSLTTTFKYLNCVISGASTGSEYATCGVGVIYYTY